MAQPVYSTQFVRGNTAEEYVYECPAGFVALITCIDAYIGIVGGGGNFTAAAGSEVTVFWSQGYDAPGEQYSKWRGKQVLTAGERIYFSSGDVFACSVSGDLLSAP
jgi:hypothetical protein